MAGMDWFRWHHGSVTDPKFALVARKAGASLPDVLAVWAYMLETASQSVERGDFGTVDCEALDCLFGFPSTETRTLNIMKAMEDRDLTVGSRINAWEKRQPKREREDSTNADRQATFRAKQNQVTPSNATENQKTPRGEKRRLDTEEKTGESAPRKPPAKRATPTPDIPRPDDIAEQTWADWLKLRKAKRAPVTQTVLNEARVESEKAGMPLEEFLRIWCRRGSQGLEAAWLKPDERKQSSPRQSDAEPAWRREQRERTQAAAPGVAVRPTTFDMEAPNGTAVALG